MSDPLLQEYKEYYATRAKRYEGNPDYQFSHKAESDLSQAMQSCNELGEFRHKIGNLNELCAIALVKDEHVMEQAHFDKHQEVVRKQAADQILAKADGCSDVNDLMTMVQQVSQQVGIEISVDEAHEQFRYDWDRLDNILIYANAEVPDQYKAEMQDSVNEIQKKLADDIVELEQEMGKFKPGWRFTPDVILQHRHRRLLPYKDEHVQPHLGYYRQLINR